jgi:hypothetical protein
MQAEVTTKFKMTEGVMVLDIKLVPRGSGNRAAAQRLGRGVRSHPDLGPHIKRVVVGTSRVTVHFLVTLEFLKIVRDLKLEENRDVPGQLALFGL